MVVGKLIFILTFEETYIFFIFCIRQNKERNVFIYEQRI